MKTVMGVVKRHEGMSFGIQTNGIPFDEDDAALVRERGVSVGISLDAPFEEVNDRLRGKGQFRAAMRVLEMLQGYEKLNVITTISKVNYEMLPALVKLLHEKRVRVFLANPVRGTQPGGRELRPDPLEAARYFLEAVDLCIRLTGRGRRIVLADFANVLLGIIAPAARVLTCDISPCGGGRKFFAVAANGDVFPCRAAIELRRIPGGNVFEDPPLEILEAESFKLVRSRVVERIEGCRECVFRNICGAPCPAEVYAEHGTMLKKPYFCDFYKRIMEHAFRIIADGKLEHVVRLSKLKKKYEFVRGGATTPG